MRFSVEILDHIFSFLVSHRSTLFACSNDPVLSQIIERQFFYHTTIGFATGRLDCTFEPDLLSAVVAESPRILTYVRILEIKVETDRSGYQDAVIQKQQDGFAKTLRLFPLLNRIILTTPKSRMWVWPDVFRAALKDCLSLATVTDVHFVGYQEVPFSLIGNCQNIESILLDGVFDAPYNEDEDEDENENEGEDGEEDGEEDENKDPASVPASRPLQVKSLTLFSGQVPAEADYIKKLQSLKCAQLAVGNLSRLLEVCSGTLKELDIDLTYSDYSTVYTFTTGKIDHHRLMKFFPIPPNLQRLSVRAPVLVENQMDEDGFFTPKRCFSYLPAIGEIINLCMPPPQHLILDINIHLFDFSSNLANVDFSPLEVLGAAAMSIPRIDLYVHTGILPSDVTTAQLLSWLADKEDVMRSIEKGILFIHPERTAPGYVEE